MLTGFLLAIKSFYKNYRVYLLIGLFIGIIVLSASMYSCLKPQPKLNETEIQQGSIAVEQHNDQKLKEILANSDARVAQADANINAAEANTNVSANPHNYDSWTHEELANELEKRAKQ